MQDIAITDHILLNLLQVLHTKGLVNAQEVAEAADQNALIRSTLMNKRPEEDASLRAAAVVLQQIADMLNRTHPWSQESGRTS